jgi:hypothetical protein
MVPYKSLDEQMLIAALLSDLNKSHWEVFNTTACKNTTKVVLRRVRAEGLGFLTKTLPRLGKALDSALSGLQPLDVTKCRFPTINGTNLPRFLGEFFKKVFLPDGTVLPSPCARSVGVIRDVCYLYYKYELPYSDRQEHDVISAFKQAEVDIEPCLLKFSAMKASLDEYACSGTRAPLLDPDLLIVREARLQLFKLFSDFDPMDVIPRHGPGVVATKQRYRDKFLWSNVSRRITDVYPLDAYFYASLGHVCDNLQSDQIGDSESSAQVLLVPKDSRGPRLISCEPVDFQWIQQGLMRAIVPHVESHYLTKDNVFFTNQQPNQFGALLGSRHGNYATLDLKEASDRVSLGLVRLLFPEPLLASLECSRSLSTVLPSGEKLILNKFAPMGSALCFPIMALTIWSLLNAGAPDQYTRERILVYGDDVIVPTAYADKAIELLERFDLQVNRAKSCTKGFFRESCGTDAFKGVNVTPTRIRSVWSNIPCPHAYSSWVAYANSLLNKKYVAAYEYIVSSLIHVYGKVPTRDMWNSDIPPVPALEYVPNQKTSTFRRRVNKALQKLEYKVPVVQSLKLHVDPEGWDLLLRYFTERVRTSKPRGLFGSSLESEMISSKRDIPINWLTQKRQDNVDEPLFGFDPPSDSGDVCMYTKRHASKLAWRWR